MNSLKISLLVLSLLTVSANASAKDRSAALSFRTEAYYTDAEELPGKLKTKVVGLKSWGYLFKEVAVLPLRKDGAESLGNALEQASNILEVGLKKIRKSKFEVILAQDGSVSLDVKDSGMPKACPQHFTLAGGKRTIGTSDGQNVVDVQFETNTSSMGGSIMFLEPKEANGKLEMFSLLTLSVKCRDGKIHEFRTYQAEAGSIKKVSGINAIDSQAIFHALAAKKDKSVVENLGRAQIPFGGRRE